MRLIFMGSEALADGFNLLGFETFADASPEDVERLLSELLKRKQAALVFLEDKLVANPGAVFLRTRAEAASIIITEIPALNAAHNYRPLVEDLVARVLGSSTLEQS
jgi:vacuolar-type H+-ATPase subunit F/Vma7